MLKSGRAMALAAMALVISIPPAEARGFGRGGGSLARFSGAAVGSFLRRSRRPEPFGRRSDRDSDLPDPADVEGTPRVSTFSRSVLEGPSARGSQAGGCAEMQALAVPVKSLPTKAEWSAQCGKVGKLAGSGMGFCVVNAD